MFIGRGAISSSLLYEVNKMKKIFPLFLWLLILAGGISWMTVQDGGCAGRPLVLTAAQKQEPLVPDAQAVNLQESFAKVAALIKPAVVSITTTHMESVQVPSNQFYF